jgi:hypothetical protein
MALNKTQLNDYIFMNYSMLFKQRRLFHENATDLFERMAETVWDRVKLHEDFGKSPLATGFHTTKIPLVKWFWAIYLTTSDKGGISALRLSKHLGVSWTCARNILKKIRTAMSH